MADNNDILEEESYDPDIITLTDEDNNEFQFEVIDAADYHDERYLAVVPYKENAEDVVEEDANLIIMRVSEEDGEEYLDIVDGTRIAIQIVLHFASRV